MDMLKMRTIQFGAALGILLLVWGCSSISGDFLSNLAPSVSFVNNQQDADSVAQVYEIPDYSFTFIDSLLGFEESEEGQFPSDTSGTVEATYELIRYQYFQLLSIESIAEWAPNEEGDLEYIQDVPEENYRLDENIGRYLHIKHTEDFRWQFGRFYRLEGVFEYRPIYSYAPMVFWRGSDPDGFVEQYRFIDHSYEEEDSLAAFIDRVLADDPTLEWITTLNTQATVNLTTELGLIQKHVLFVQAVDNDGLVSEPAMRVFNRSNRAPNTPRLSYHKDGYTLNSQPQEYTRHVVTWSDVEVDFSTIYELEENLGSIYEIPIYREPLQNWNGVRFLVSGDDPDDDDIPDFLSITRVPLQFQYNLHRIPEDSVEVWMNPDSNYVNVEPGTSVFDLDESYRVGLDNGNMVDYDTYEFVDEVWTDRTQVELFNLPTGSYQLTVYSRDDGYERSPGPAWMRFHVQEVTLDRDLLLINFTQQNSAAYLGMDDVDHAQYYRELVEESLPIAKSFALEVESDSVIWMDEVAEGEDYSCRYWQIGADAEYPYLLPFSVLSAYKAILCVDDKWAQGAGSGAGAQIRLPFKGMAMDYLDMGGALFWTGFSSLAGTFYYSPNENTTLTDGSIAERAGDFLSNYMGVSSVYVDIIPTFYNQRADAILSGLPEFDDMDTLRIDPAMIAALRQNASYNGRYDDGDSLTAPDPRRPAPDSSLIYIEALALNESAGATAFYTYNSYSAGLDPETTFDFFAVATEDELPPIFHTTDDTNYPAQDPWFENLNTDPGPDGCWLKIIPMNYWDITIFEAYDVYNVSRPDSMWGNPQVIAKAVEGVNQRLFIYVNHQTLQDPADYWQPGDTVHVDALWQPVLEKHRKPVMCFTENLAYEATFGGFGINPYYTNFRTAFNTLPLHLVERGATIDIGFNGRGSLGLMSGVFYLFYTPKIQDVID